MCARRPPAKSAAFARSTPGRATPPCTGSSGEGRRPSRCLPSRAAESAGVAFPGLGLRQPPLGGLELGRRGSHPRTLALHLAPCLLRLAPGGLPLLGRRRRGLALGPVLIGRRGCGDSAERAEPRGRAVLHEPARREPLSQLIVDRSRMECRAHPLELRLRAGPQQRLGKTDELADLLALLGDGGPQDPLPPAAESAFLRRPQPLARPQQRAELALVAPGELVHRPGGFARLLQPLDPVSGLVLAFGPQPSGKLVALAGELGQRQAVEMLHAVFDCAGQAAAHVPTSSEAGTRPRPSTSTSSPGAHAAMSCSSLRKRRRSDASDGAPSATGSQSTSAR